METAYLLPLTLLLLTLAVATLGFRAQRRRGYGPLIVGGGAAVLLVLGKFVLHSNLAVYGGVPALIGASVWNAWPKRSITSVPVAPTGTLIQIGSIEKES